jgi:pimeloyl-ACP methyl ester carboxylesterase
LIIARDDMPEDLQLLKRFEQLGIEVTQAAQPGYADMMAEPHYTKVPRQAIAHGVDWLLAGTTDEQPNTDKPVPATAIEEDGYERAVCVEHGIRERVLPISHEPNLFGVLTEPAEGAGADVPMIVMVNSGSCHRVGPNRLYVFLARMLAGRGFRSLRVDLCGLGDSVGCDPERENDCYPETGFRDIDVTLKSLRTQLGVERVVLLGLCSGAYTAFQSAAQLSSPALVESVLINPLTFFWRDGMPLEFSPAHQLQSFQNVVASLWQPRKWWKLLSGRSKIGIGGALKILLQRWQPSRAGNQSLSVLGEPAVDALPTHPLRDDLPGDLDRVAKNGRRLACFFARSDPGHAILAHQAKRKVDELSRAGMLNIYFLEEADHTFSRRALRRALGEAITEHLARRYG